MKKDTEKPESNASTLDTRDLFDFLLNQIPDRIYFKDKQSRFVRISRAMAEFFGMASPAESIGKTDFDFFTPEHAQPAFDDEQQIMASGQPVVGKIEKETMPTGEMRWALTTKMPLRDARGEIIGTCGISKDITSLKEMEDNLARSNIELEKTLAELKKTHEQLKAAQGQLIEAEKMQTEARLIAGLAHEVRNPLNTINTGIEFLGGDPRFAEDPLLNTVIGEIREAVGRADAVICALMDSSQESALILKKCSINDLVERVLSARAAELSAKKINLTKQLADKLPVLKLDRKKIESVLDGVIHNAMEAMSATGGELILTTQVKEVALADMERESGGRSGIRTRAANLAVSIKIEDTGPGVPTEAVEKVFDPFFTTKETDKGTGLGLTVCRKILELHHGSIKIANRKEGGACVTIILQVPQS